MTALVDLLAPLAGISALAGAGPEVEAIERSDGKRRYLALLNHSELGAADIVKQSLVIAGEICIYTNQNHTIEILE